MIIKKAVLHILDFSSQICVCSQRELDFSHMAVSEFLEKHLERVLEDSGQKKGTFLSDSAFALEVKQYQQGELDLIGISVKAANLMHEYISRTEQTDAIDFLAVEFSEDEVPYLAFLLLTNKSAYTHQVINDGEGIRNEIIRHQAILPSTSQRIDCYGVIRCDDLTVGFVDKKRVIDGQNVYVLQERLLQCTSSMSTKEAIKVVNKITTKIAEDHGANAAIAISKAKNYLIENAENASSFSPREMGREVFAESAIMREAFEREIRETALPPAVEVEMPLAVRTGKNHKIKTDTGIEITFPAHYFQNQEFIEFINQPDGTISIALKNIGKIVNK